MISEQTEYLLSKVILSIIETEHKVELARQILCENPNFEPYSLFGSLDRLNKGYLDIYDFEYFVKRNQIVLQIQDFNIILTNYGSLQNFAIHYQEFMELVLTNQNLVLRNIATQRTSETQVPITQDVEECLTRILSNEIKGTKQTEILKQELQIRYDFKMKDAFKCIDRDATAYIDMDQMKQFIRRNGYEVTDDEISAIYKRYD